MVFIPYGSPNTDQMTPVVFKQRVICSSAERKPEAVLAFLRRHLALKADPVYFTDDARDF